VEELDRYAKSRKILFCEFRVFRCHPAARPDTADIINLFIAVNSYNNFYVPFTGLAVGEICYLNYIGAGFADPVKAGDAEIKVSFLHIRRNFLRAQDLHFANTIISNTGIVIAVSTPDLKISLSEKLERLRLKAAFGECDGNHTIQDCCKKR
jgi:hypothetical protein